MLTEELKNISTSMKEVRKFGLLVGSILIAIGIWFFVSDRDFFRPLIQTGTALVAFGVLAPYVLRPVYRAWMMFSVVLGWIMTRVLLSVLFFVIVTPVALIARIVGKKFLDLDFHPREGVKTYWHPRATGVSSKRRLEHQF